MQKSEILQKLHPRIEEIRGFGVRSLQLFGSSARGEAAWDSDVDLLVDFAESPSFRRFMDLRFFLEDILGSKVDLVTVRGLRERVRSSVEKDAIRVA